MNKHDNIGNGSSRIQFAINLAKYSHKLLEAEPHNLSKQMPYILIR